MVEKQEKECVDANLINIIFVEIFIKINIIWLIKF